MPLAFLLDDEALKNKASAWIDYILTHQHQDGWVTCLMQSHCLTGVDSGGRVWL